MGDVPHDVNGEIVYVPQAQVVANLEGKPDGSYYFLLSGGPMHGHRIRVYPPFSRIVFTTPQGVHLNYEIHPPLDKTGKWCYVHNGERLDDYSDDERTPSGKWGRTRSSSEVDASWRNHDRYKYADSLRVERLVAARQPKTSEFDSDDFNTGEEE